MKRTQIQLPDALYTAAHRVAEQKEISLAELVRRGLEYMIAVTPGADHPAADWNLPAPRALHADDPFNHPAWREDLHMGRLKVAEDRKPYGKGND